MPEGITIRTLKNPTKEELDDAAEVLVEALLDKSITQAACGGDKSKMFAFHRSCIAAAAIGGKLVIAETDMKQVIGAVTYMGPGKELMGDDEQQAQGFLDFLSTLPSDIVTWWMEKFLPEYAAITDTIIGPGVKTSAWSINSLGVAQDFRGRGIGRALIEAGEILARADKVPMFGETEHIENLRMFEHLGYELIGQQRLTGGGPVKDIDVYVLKKEF
ncbi:hypothetical protein PUNSTDRAFT_132241 [Punctularia strigosozonata HHB-11173 SS5]|uniref:uncharacterized protein n=1 Tax=Punctularia strigosozonata (strain HHB-11173) TaxID=741275 RepID=UPI00044167AB|nr:uncharacterized protein PUNSTDRAFT_132241 [Punctularia strigosozonata HHB-11173 SS5]EIN10134.1 hypothetical protein PUNSTDRAFT_132241 [Punctularia strigosozonata HHB-11173 SS5]